MPENTRYQLLFDMKFAQWVARVEETGGEEWMAVWPGFPLIMNHEALVTAMDGKTIAFLARWQGADPCYPLIDTENKKILGVFVPATRKLFIYEKPLLQGKKLEFGRYLVFIPYWEVVHQATKVHTRQPTVLLLNPN